MAICCRKAGICRLQRDLALRLRLHHHNLGVVVVGVEPPREAEFSWTTREVSRAMLKIGAPSMQVDSKPGKLHRRTRGFVFTLGIGAWAIGLCSPCGQREKCGGQKRAGGGCAEMGGLAGGIGFEGSDLEDDFLVEPGSGKGREFLGRLGRRRSELRVRTGRPSWEHYRRLPVSRRVDGERCERKLRVGLASK